MADKCKHENGWSVNSLVAQLDIQKGRIAELEDQLKELARWTLLANEHLPESMCLKCARVDVRCETCGENDANYTRHPALLIADEWAKG